MYPYFDRFDICEAYRQIEIDYNVSGMLQERKSNQRRKESTDVQLHRMGYKGIAQGYYGMSENARAIYDELEIRYGFVQETDDDNDDNDDDDTYNGWTNWATWNTNLWLTNDYDLYQLVMSIDSAADLEGYIFRHTRPNGVLSGLYTDLSDDGSKHIADVLDTINYDEIFEALHEE